VVLVSVVGPETQELKDLVVTKVPKELLGKRVIEAYAETRV
jgi:hypothetical protein